MRMSDITASKEDPHLLDNEGEDDSEEQEGQGGDGSGVANGGGGSSDAGGGMGAAFGGRRDGNGSGRQNSVRFGRIRSAAIVLIFEELMLYHLLWHVHRHNSGPRCS